MAVDHALAALVDMSRAFPPDEEPGLTIARLLDDLARPVRIGISGRAGVGRSRLARILADSIAVGPAGEPDLEVVDLPAIDSPDHPDPELDHDVLVHVVVGGLHRVDRDVLGGRDPATTVVALGKVDRLEDAGAVVEQIRRSTGFSLIVVPPVDRMTSPVAADDPPELLRECARRSLWRRRERAVHRIAELAAEHRQARDRLEVVLQRDADQRIQRAGAW